MVDPDVARVLDLHEILALGRIMEVQVPQDHVGRLLHAEPAVRQARAGPGSEHGRAADKVDD